MKFIDGIKIEFIYKFSTVNFYVVNFSIFLREIFWLLVCVHFKKNWKISSVSTQYKQLSHKPGCAENFPLGVVLNLKNPITSTKAE